MIKRALISVSDKTGIVEFAGELAKRGVTIISTGGTHKTLEAAGIPVTGISEVTGFPECLDGRVKTLHPKIHGGLLSVRSNPAHMQQIADLGIETIDMVVVNLYPFKKTIEKPDVTLEEAIENIDIGGPSMLRSAAKNYAGVVVLTDPADYACVLKEWDEIGDVTYDTRFRLAAKVYTHTSYYDAMIARYMNRVRGDDSFHNIMTLPFEKVQEMRYGENPHQKAAFYKETSVPAGTLPAAKQLHGKELSYNNINDANGALDLLREFDPEKGCAVVAVKHANPCGVGLGDSVYEAYMNAYEADPVSIFGGIVASNHEIDLATAREISKIFLEIVIAPSFTQEALDVIAAKKNIRILELPDISAKLPDDTLDMKKVAGGILVQQYNASVFCGADRRDAETESEMKKLLAENEMQIVTERIPTAAELRDMLFGMKVVKHVKSNGIAVVKGRRTIGIGPGQTNRIGAAMIAFQAGGEQTKGAVMASDAFFPFDDCVEAAAAAGITAIIQPGGSKNDPASIEACNRCGIAMVFTGMRHFKH